MSGETKPRRERILQLLQEAGIGEPLSASVLAAKFSVSRQIIVGDIALLRSAGYEIDATPRGYCLRKEAKVGSGVTYTLVCCHTAAQMEDELNTLVDFGCTVIDVAVEHPIYGTLTGELGLSSRYDVSLFSARVRAADALPLSALTEGIHVHNICCPNEALLEKVKTELSRKGYLKE